jgi:hypothetical protein
VNRFEILLLKESGYCSLAPGSGSVAEIALLNGRNSVSYEMNPNYNQLQKSRLDAAVDAYNASNQTFFISFRKTNVI